MKIVPETPLDRVRDSLLSTGFFFTFRASKWCPEGSLGASRGALGWLLARSWALLGRSWDDLDRSWALLGRSSDALGTLLGALHSLLGRSAPLLDPHWAIWNGFWSIRGSILVPPDVDFGSRAVKSMVTSEIAKTWPNAVRAMLRLPKQWRIQC